jgi:NTE family protein
MSRALVFSGGGRSAGAWMLGLIAGLRELGIDLADADLVVGTSAGARVATQLATGAVDRAIDACRSARLPLAKTYAGLPDFIAAAGPILASAPNELEAARRIANLGPLGPGLASAAERRNEIAAYIPVRTWPSKPLKISAVDADTGRRVTFDAGSGASLLDAVTASGALPGIYPLAEIDGRRFADGGAHSLYNADLAAGHDAVVVIGVMPVTPSRRRQLDAELAALGNSVNHVIQADEPSLAAIGPDPVSAGAGAQIPALDAGMAQAAREAASLRSAWFA